MCFVRSDYDVSGSSYKEVILLFGGNTKEICNWKILCLYVLSVVAIV